MRIRKINFQEINFEYCPYPQSMYDSIKRIGLSFPIKVNIIDGKYYCKDGHKRLSIIQDLLKNEDLSKEQQDEYIDILDRNTKRLKTLIEDLFEVSKVNSGNIQLNPIDLDIHALLQQVLFEYQEQFEHHHLNLKNDYENKKIICHLDSEKTYRVLENLCQNICKYALEHTRVYLQIVETNQQVIVVFKNISAHEISNPGDLTERFVQGDASRKSEGSGLGLAICKSFVEVQGGTFEVNVDGDLFKTTIIFPKKIEND
ncbi:MAG: sensor histidine kinase, partial [Coprobacillus sp.]|nr:sensor histidine kinase [Coprobacillus sp.]